MAFTYSGNPAGSPLDQVRFLAGDTLAGTSLLQDEEIAYLLAKTGNEPIAAALLCIESMMVRCAHMVDETVGRVSISYSQRLTNLKEIRNMLASRQSRVDCALPIAGGISYSDKAKSQSNPDLVQPRFIKANTREPPPERRSYPLNPLLGRQWR